MQPNRSGILFRRLWRYQSLVGRLETAPNPLLLKRLICQIKVFLLIDGIGKQSLDMKAILGFHPWLAGLLAGLCHS